MKANNEPLEIICMRGLYQGLRVNEIRTLNNQYSFFCSFVRIPLTRVSVDDSRNHIGTLFLFI